MPEGQPKRLLDQVRELMRVRRYALRTERAYCNSIRRYGPIDFLQFPKIAPKQVETELTELTKFLLKKF
jgi:Phage integrase, N-terminal SAM-like domain